MAALLREHDLLIGLISAYALIGATPDAEWDAHLDAFNNILRRCPSDAILVIATDASSSIGTNALHQGPTVAAPHGLAYVNTSGKRFNSWAASSQLSATTTFFDHQHHATWTNPGRLQQAAPN